MLPNLKRMNKFMKRKKIGIIGHFGGEEKFLDGQTIKTKILHEELCRLDKYDIIVVDTYYFKKSKIRLLKDTLKCLAKCELVFILVSGGGMKIYFPILYYWNKLFGIKVIHDVIGGSLPNHVRANKNCGKYLNSFYLNLVESVSMKNELENLGIDNSVYFPNFKRLSRVEENNIYYGRDDVFEFCTFSRVTREKGVEDAINAVEKINSDAGRTVCKLDIYGEIDVSYKERFTQVMADASEAVVYKGLIEYGRSVESINNYYALLFPTYWDGEGFAGTVIDAYFSALPVIATDWNINSEIIPHMECGIVYPDDKIKNLEEAILWSIDNKEKMHQMKRNCLKKSMEYDVDVLMGKLMEYIE